ncbi:MAG TPA: aminoglycoside phosphotransferase family protein [Anaerolineales bacterium]|nr:aminoglycoside phosphotransferase family protein [Anaerolineales bacterium]
MLKPQSPAAPAPIAEGRTAEIFLWDDRHVLKLYRDWCPPDWVEYEARIARAIHAAGIPSPAAGEIVEVNGRRGLVYERLEGISMLQDMNARPWTLWKHARSLAELQVKVHQQSIPGLPIYKERLGYDIRNAQHLSEDLQDKALALLDALPEGKSVCHGDYHPGNVLLTKNGPVVIDWMTACTGSPWTDAARTSLILSIGARAAGKQVNPMIRMAIRLYHRTYINQYCAHMSKGSNELQRWMPVIAAARLSENIIPEREALIKLVKEGVAEQTSS